MLVNLIANAIKFTRSKEVAQIEIGTQETDEAEVVIFIRDNGKGFDMDTVQNRIGRVSLGLAGMEERAMLLGGSLDISSRPNYGTEVKAVIPYQLIKLEGSD